MSRLGGLWRMMPWTASLFALGAAAISGLPPLNGFVSEWLVYLGLFDATMAPGPAAWAAVPAAILLGVTGAGARVFCESLWVVFLGAPRSPAAAHAHESGPAMRGAMVLLGAACVAIGLAPVVFWPAVLRAVDAWNPVWVGAETPVALASLGMFHVALAVLALVAAVWLWRRAQRGGLTRALTWDCGYVSPTPRMQYTAGSFAGIITEWFAWILRPVRQEHRPEVLLPHNASAHFAHAGDRARTRRRARGRRSHARFADGAQPPARAAAILPVVFADRSGGAGGGGPAWKQGMKSAISQTMYLNLIQIAESFGVSESVVEGWIRNEGLPHTPDRGRLLFDRAQVAEWATKRGLAAHAGFLAPETSALGTSLRLGPLLRVGGIWRDVPAADVSVVFERIVNVLPGATRPSGNCSPASVGERR
jgi:hypothetical protein